MPGPTQTDHSKRFECPICQKKFAVKKNKDDHVLLHKNAGRFKCGQCDKTFQIRTSFEYHERTHTGEKPFECPICQKHFPLKQTRDNHVVLVHENAGRLKCGYCLKTFQCKKDLKRHERVHTGERPFPCEECPKRFTRKSHLEVHVLDLHSEKKFTCETCGRCFGREAAFKLHLATHSEETPFQCELCLKSYATENLLNMHHLCSHAEKKFKCDTCGKAFGMESVLQKHLAIHSERPFQCELCQMKFVRVDQLRSHRLNLHAEKKFNCDQCDKSFGREAALKLHLATHSEEKQFQCEECPRSFSRENKLKSHHLDCHAERKIKCDQCGNGFGSDAGLKRHLVIHLEEKQFQCELCPKRFSIGGNLKQHHFDSHAEKKFRCSQCGKAFGSERNLKRHLLSHSNEKTNCGLCGKSLKQTNLKYHMKTYHSANQPKTPTRRRLIQGESPKEHQMERQKALRVKVEQPDGSDDLAGATNSLRARRKTANYIGQDDDESEESEENGDEVQDGEPSEPDEESGPDEAVGHDEEQDGDRVGYNEMTTKTENLVPDGEVDAFDEPARNSQREMKRKRDLADQTRDDQPAPSKKPTASKLTPIPNQRTIFDCYGFDLVRNNQRRMRVKSGQKDEQSGRKDEGSDQEEKGNAGEDEVSDSVLHEEEHHDRVSGNEMSLKRVKVESLVFDDPISGSQQTIKREHDLDFETENDEDVATTPYKSSDPVQSASSTIPLSSGKDGVLYEEASSGLEQYNSRVSCNEMSTKKVKTEHTVPDAEVRGGAHGFDGPISPSSDENEPDVAMSPESSTVTGANLKLVYDVEYRAPY